VEKFPCSLLSRNSWPCWPKISPNDFEIITFEVRRKEILGLSKQGHNRVLLEPCGEGGIIQFWKLDHWIGTHFILFVIVQTK